MTKLMSSFNFLNESPSFEPRLQPDRNQHAHKKLKKEEKFSVMFFMTSDVIKAGNAISEMSLQNIIISYGSPLAQSALTLPSSQINLVQIVPRLEMQHFKP